jgi:mono/diheme cytochrome c family protein
MKRRLGGLAGAGLSLFLLLGASPAPKRNRPSASLPVFGTKLAELPPGAGKAIADRACLQCHSADMLRQQHLTEKQWTASVTKMAGWGAEVRDEEKADLIAYLAKNFGPDAGPFQPVETQPLSASQPAH